MLVEDMLLEEQGSIPADFKFYVFGGKARLLRVQPDASATIAPTASARISGRCPLRRSPLPTAPYAASLETHDLTRLVR
jgi:hypothetical protein